MSKKFRSRLMRKYRLTIHNENKLENVLGFYISPLWVILSLFFSFLLVAGVIYLILAFTPVIEYLPGRINNQTRETLVNYNLKIDSLKEVAEKQDRYLANIKNLMEGNHTIDSVLNAPELPSTDEISIVTSELEKEFAAAFEEREKYNLTSYATSVGTLQELNLYRPTSGVVIRNFSPQERHYGVDIAENPGESVLAIHGGTVVMSDYTAKEGYTIAIQHRENLVSIYRNCHRLLKEVGEKVSAGEVIATLGSSSDKEGETKPYLHFELWHRGKALDPNIYIAF
ncbi:MAG: M23 family metallopeptidase [Bacteroidaceae bacterium]|nr:M23 family metallopeptidase [Bacteroidaceae bacterium]